MKLSLVVLSAGKEGQTIPITLSQFIIGRDPQCQLRPASPLISKRHCAILKKDNRVFIRDFNSTNGTAVNDEPVKGERELKNNDLLKVGPLLFRVALQVPAAVNKPTPPPATVGAGEDESIAAMLLGPLDDAPDAPAGEVTPDSIPDGTTVMDIPALKTDAPAPQEPATPAPAAKKPEPAKEGMSSAAAAADILKRYAQRRRG